jgi:hypothetical protein
LHTTDNKKGALSSAEDESAPVDGYKPGAGKHTHLFGNPAIRLRCEASADPWLCVTRFLWFCLFGEHFLILDQVNACLALRFRSKLISPLTPKTKKPAP